MAEPHRAREEREQPDPGYDGGNASNDLQNTLAPTVVSAEDGVGGGRTGQPWGFSFKGCHKCSLPKTTGP
jgi:hypothetical protein